MIRFFSCFAVLLLLCGCMDLNYVGQTFTPLPMSEPVTYFAKQEEMPADQYGIMGRVTIKAPGRYDMYDFQERLQEFAREKGANAVCLVDCKRVHYNSYEADGRMLSSPSAFNNNPANLSASGNTQAINSFGTPSTLEPKRSDVFRWEVRALLLMDKKQLDRLVKERAREAAFEPAFPAQTPKKSGTSEK